MSRVRVQPNVSWFEKKTQHTRKPGRWCLYIYILDVLHCRLRRRPGSNPHQNPQLFQSPIRASNQMGLEALGQQRLKPREKILFFNVERMVWLEYYGVLYPFVCWFISLIRIWKRTLHESLSRVTIRVIFCAALFEFGIVIEVGIDLLMYTIFQCHNHFKV